MSQPKVIDALSITELTRVITATETISDLTSDLAFMLALSPSDRQRFAEILARARKNASRALGKQREAQLDAMTQPANSTPAAMPLIEKLRELKAAAAAAAVKKV